MTAEDVRDLMRKRMRACQSRREFARQVGISEGSLSNMLSGRHGPSAKLLAALGLVAVVDYRPKSEVAGQPDPKPKPKRLFRYGDWPCEGPR